MKSYALAQLEDYRKQLMAEDVKERHKGVIAVRKLLSVSISSFKQKFLPFSKSLMRIFCQSSFPSSPFSPSRTCSWSPPGVWPTSHRALLLRPKKSWIITRFRNCWSYWPVGTVWSWSRLFGCWAILPAIVFSLGIYLLKEGFNVQELRVGEIGCAFEWLLVGQDSQMWNMGHFQYVQRFQ